MTRALFLSCSLAVGMTLAVSSWCAAESATTINILSPRNGETVAGTFDI